MTTKDLIAFVLILMGLLFSVQLTAAEGGPSNEFSADNVVVSNVTSGSQASVSKTMSLENNKPNLEPTPLAGSVVPEPTTIGLLSLGAMALLAKRNRRRKAV